MPCENSFPDHAFVDLYNLTVAHGLTGICEPSPLFAAEYFDLNFKGINQRFPATPRFIHVKLEDRATNVLLHGIWLNC